MLSGSANKENAEQAPEQADINTFKSTEGLIDKKKAQLKTQITKNLKELIRLEGHDVEIKIKLTPFNPGVHHYK